MRLLVFSSVSLMLLFLAVPAAAQLSADVSEARGRALDGSFQSAMAALDAALGRSDLSRDDLVAVYEARAFVHYATEARDELRTDLQNLAALDPTHVFDGDYFPAAVTDQFRTIAAQRAGRLAIAAEALVLATGELEVRGEVANDPGELSRAIRVYGRPAGGAWVSGDASVRVDVAGADVAEYYAETIGPGGAIVARDGSEGAPRSIEISLADQGGGGGVPLWVWIAGGATLVAIGVVIAVAVAASSGVSDETQPTGPMVRFSM